MACCGSRRAAIAPQPKLDATQVEFIYRGSTTLTAVGGVTRRLYWFGGPGARVKVHPRDAASMDGVPALQRIARPSS